MRRRVVSAKKLPSKKSKTPDIPQASNYLHITCKLACGWGLILFLDAIVGFRMEYLYPAVMFLRSVLDSYKEHGLIFSLFFIMLVLYLDIICWTLIIGPWLFLCASACVWFELIISWGTSFSYGSFILWLIFVYVEISQRLTFSSSYIVTLLRPFGAHCIGFPVITMTLQLKRQLKHAIRQRQQKQVSEENSRCFDILLKALPLDEDELIEENNGGKGSPLPNEELSSDSRNNKIKVVSKSPTGGSNSNNNTKNITNSHLNGGKASNSKSHVNKTLTSNNNNNYVGVVTAKRDTSPITTNNNKSHDVNKGISTPLLWKQDDVTLVSNCISGAGASPTVNGEISSSSSRPSSASKISSTAPHVIGVKKHALVKAVPRTDLQQQMDAREKAAKSTEALLLEVKEERSQKLQLESDVIRLEKEVKRLQADLHATSLQEQEANERILLLSQQERLSRTEAQRLRHESESLQNRLAKLSSSKSQDMGNISTLEDQLKQELTQRRRLESQLREQRSQASTQSQWSKEEMKELKEKLNKRDREVTHLQSEHQQLQKKYQNLSQSVSDKTKECMSLQEQMDHLKVSLADETRVKIELFQYLSEARKKHEGLMEQVKKRDQEIEALKQKLHHMVAIHSTWTPSLTSPHH